MKNTSMKPLIQFICRLLLTALLIAPLTALNAAEPKAGDSKRIDLGDGVTLEVVYLSPATRDRPRPCHRQGVGVTNH